MVHRKKLIEAMRQVCGWGSKRPFVVLVLIFAALSFFVIEIMHYLLVSDLEGHMERLLAEGGSALILGCLLAKLVDSANKLRQTTAARLQVVEEMNHHIRNALSAIVFSTYLAQNEQATGNITQAVGRIEWALREILPRQIPAGDDGTASFSQPPSSLLPSGQAQEGLLQQRFQEKAVYPRMPPAPKIACTPKNKDIARV